MREDDGASRAVNGAKEPKSLTEEDEDGVSYILFFGQNIFLILMFMQFFY